MVVTRQAEDVMQKQTGSGLHHTEREKSSKCFFCIKDDSVSIFPPPCASLKGTCSKQIPQPSRVPQGPRQGAGDKWHVPRTVPWHMPTAALLAPRLRAGAGGGSQGPGREAFVSPSKCAEPLGTHGVRRKQRGPGEEPTSPLRSGRSGCCSIPSWPQQRCAVFSSSWWWWQWRKLLTLVTCPPAFHFAHRIPFPFSKQPYLEILIPVSVSEVNKARLREIQKTCPWSHSWSTETISAKLTWELVLSDL